MKIRLQYSNYRTEQNSIYSLSQLQSYKIHGLLNIHIQSNNYSVDGINFHNSFRVVRM